MSAASVSAFMPTFVWTSEEGRRARKAWLRYTENGRSHRKSFWLLLLCGIAGLAFGILAVVTTRPIHLGAMLFIASAVLLLLLYCWRVRAPRLAPLGARITWEVRPEGLRLDVGGAVEDLPWATIRRVLRTPAGFWVWPNDAFERWLPGRAFTNPAEEEEMASLARTKVKRYAEIS